MRSRGSTTGVGLVLAACLAVACARDRGGATAGSATGRAAGSAATAPRATDAPPARRIDTAIDAAAAVAGPIPATARLLVTSVSADWDAVDTQLALYRRAGADAAWERVRTWRGALGHTGLAWGHGLHGDGAPAGRDGPRKREGDGKSPAGVFTLDGSYGYAAAPPPGSRLPYTQLGASWRCVDDGASASYNQIVDGDVVKQDWTSAEEMRRKDVLYTWVVQVGHNPTRTPGDGSCIFLHVWRKPGSGTVGCTAMAQPELEALLAELDPDGHPVLVQLTAETYDALAAAWRLPPR